MNIRKEFKTQIDSAEVITEETIQKIIQGRKDGIVPGMKQEHIDQMLDEDKIREEYPIGDKSLYVIVYPSKSKIKEAKKEQKTVKVQVTKILESELEEFAETHKSLGARPDSEIPRFQET